MMDPSRSVDLEALIEAASIEARLMGERQATLFHLARTLARHTPEAFDARFGTNASSNLLRKNTQPLERHQLPFVDAIVGKLRQPWSIHDLVDALGRTLPWLEAFATTRADADTELPTLTPVGYELAGAAAELAEVVGPDPTVIGRERVVEEILKLICRKTPVTPLIVGKAGSGKTALLRALAARMESAPGLSETPLVRIGTEALLRQDPAEALDRVLDSLSHGEVVAVDDLDAALSLGTSTVATSMLLRLRGAVEDSATRLILVIDARYVDRLDSIDDELEHELTRIELDDLSQETLHVVAERAAADLGAHHGVTVPFRLARTAARPPGPRELRVHPGLLIDRLDAACATANLRGSNSVSDDDLRLGEGASDDTAFKPSALVDALEQRIRGQTHAIEAIANRLALTRARLDLRPERPDGVFFLVGPTGVGKTALACALAEHLFGSEDRLIRLDMSEYAESWSLSRIIGPQPGYVGSTQPENWLTTRILAQPDCVLLLDELEKAHPDVWDTFLQVFDAGRLTDSRGEIADFSRSIIMMTSNVGSDVFTDRRGVGFGDHAPVATAEGRRRAVERAVENALSPELFNRLDAVIVFNELSEEVLIEVASAVLDRTRLRLLGRGFTVDFAPAVVEAVAKLGHDPRYGARHLERNIERHLLEPLALLEERDVIAEVAEGRIYWRVRATPA